MRRPCLFGARLRHGGRPPGGNVTGFKTAKALGVDVPLHLQQIADEVIE